MKLMLFLYVTLIALFFSTPVFSSAQATGPVLTVPARPAPDPLANPTLPTGPVANGASPASSPGYRIGPDDSLEITVWKEPTLSGTFLVRPDGMISMVLLGDVHASGQTPMQLTDTLSVRLQKFLQNPLVAVTVMAANSQKVYVLGEVQHVGPVQMSTSMSPLQAIAAAGGLTPYANEKKVYILRGAAGKQEKIPFNYKSALKGTSNSSVMLMAGDTIVVP